MKEGEEDIDDEWKMLSQGCPLSAEYYLAECFYMSWYPSSVDEDKCVFDCCCQAEKGETLVFFSYAVIAKKNEFVCHLFMSCLHRLSLPCLR